MKSTEDPSLAFRDLDAGIRSQVQKDLIETPELAKSVELQKQKNADEAEGLPVFPAIAFRGVFAEYALAMHGTTEASDVAHFATLWAAIGSALGRSAHWISGGVIFPNVYLCIFGSSGDKKTTAMRRIYEASLLAQAPHVEIVAGVGTPEGLAEHFEKVNGAADQNTSLFFWEEFASMLAQGRWTGATILQFLTETFDCPPIWEKKFRVRNAVSIAKPTPSILTGTTSDWFWKSARQEDFYGGCLNRFLFLTGRKKSPIPDPAKVDPTKLRNVKRTIARFSRSIARESVEAHWTVDAARLWAEFYREHEGRDRAGLLGVAIKRIHVYARKLALAYAACEDSLPSVTEEQLRAAIAVVTYGERCAEILIDVCSQNVKSESELERRFVAWVRKNDGARVRYMQQTLSKYCGTSENFNRLLRALHQSDQVEIRDRRVYLIP